MDAGARLASQLGLSLDPQHIEQLQDYLLLVFQAPRKLTARALAVSGLRSAPQQQAATVFSLWAAQHRDRGLLLALLAAAPPVPAPPAKARVPALQLAVATGKAASHGSSHGRSGSDSHLALPSSPLSGLVTPVPTAAREVRRQLSGQRTPSSTASEAGSGPGSACSDSDSMCSHPVDSEEEETGVEQLADDAVAAAHRQSRTHTHAHPAARLALCAAAALVPLAAAATLAASGRRAVPSAAPQPAKRGGAGRAAHAATQLSHGAPTGAAPASHTPLWHTRGLAASAGMTPLRRFAGQEEFREPREVPFWAPKPSAFLAKDD